MRIKNFNRFLIMIVTINLIVSLIVTIPAYVGLIRLSKQIDALSVKETEEVPTEDTKESAPDIILETKPEVIRTSLGTYTTTAYCSCSKCCGQWADGITATGTVATQGRTIAVDPNKIPLGSVVEINGVKYIAEDTGGAIKFNKIDIFFNDHQEALNYGVQSHEVFLIEEGGHCD